MDSNKPNPADRSRANKSGQLHVLRTVAGSLVSADRTNTSLPSASLSSGCRRKSDCTVASALVPLYGRAILNSPEVGITEIERDWFREPDFSEFAARR